MPSAQQFLNMLEATVKDVQDSSAIDPCSLYWIEQIREIVNDNIPELAHMRIGYVYLFEAKGKNVRAVVTKSNTKTWVLYETTDSSRPGCRWMLGKSWCTTENIDVDTAQSYMIPETVVIK